MFLTILVLMVVALWLGQSVWGAVGEGFEDSFDAPELHPRWEWRVPVAGPTFSLTAHPGHLRLTVPQREGGYNHWTGPHGADAPLLLTPAPPGDWRFEGHLQLVDYGPESNFHLALVVAFSPRYLLAWGPFQGHDLWNMTAPEVWLEPTGEGKFLTAPGDARDVFLRIDKDRLTYHFFLQRPGEADWTEVGQYEALFEPQFVGLLGKTFGAGPAVTLDVDTLKLERRERLPRRVEPVRITVDARQVTGTIHPHLYGHFIEHLGRCIYGGIWAELLTNRKFTGDAGPDGVIEGWQAIGAGEGVEFARDNVEVYTGGQAQRITAREGGQVHGLVQKGIPLQAGSYNVRVVLKQRDLQGLVLVTLRQGDKVYARRAIPRLSEEWTPIEFRMSVEEEDLEAEFAITTEAAGTFWVGAASLLPSHSVDGMRRDVLNAVKALQPPIIRWPGGNFVSGYHWRDGIGPRDQRPPRWDRAWGAWEWNDFGTDEFIQFCRWVGAEPYICVNLGEAGPEEAAAWVEYCNGGPDTPMGRWRAANGHPEPYRVAYWGLGNEMYGPWQLGHLDPVKYALKAVECARAMRAVDPQIQLIGVGVEANGWDEWNRKVMEIAGSYFDCLAVHYYRGVSPDDDPLFNYSLVVEAPLEVEKMLAETAAIAARSHPEGKPIPLAFDEWNVWPADARVETAHEANYSLRDGLFAAGIFHALHRLSDRVTMANLAQLVNVLGALRTNPRTVVQTPLYLAFKLYGENTGPQRLAVTLEGVPHRNGRPLLDVSATLSEDGKMLYLAVLNRHPLQPYPSELQIQGFIPDIALTVLQLTAEDFRAMNTFAEPEAVQIREQRLILKQAQRFTFPPQSATIFRFWR